MKTFTIEDISNHNKIDDCWVSIYDEVYDITDFMKKEHPGSFIPLSVSGKDATNIFIATHPSYVKIMLDPNSIFYKNYHVGTIHEKNRSLSNDNLYFELKEQVEKYILNHNLRERDIPLFDLEVIVFIVLTIVTYIKLLTSKYIVCFSILHGITWTFMMTRTIHDCNHGCLTKENRWKRYLFTFVVEIFSSNQSWQAKHNLHHMYTNDCDKDPDVKAPFRLSKKIKPKYIHLYQSVYTLFLYSLYSLNNIAGNRFISDTDAEPVHKSFFYVAKGILVSLIYATIRYERFKYWILSMMLSGFYLGIVFSVNHNLYYLTDEYRNTNSFLEEQLSSTSDYNPGSKITNFITHGLNHQTIHHLFPSINYHNYPELTKNVLIPFCKKYNLNYHGEKKTFLELVYIHLISLYRWRK